MLLPLFSIYMHSFSVEKKTPFRPGENVMLPHCIFSLDTRSVTPPPPLLSVFYQSLLMSHFSVGETIIMFFFVDLLLLLMFAMIWGNSWPPGAKRLSAIFLLVRPELWTDCICADSPWLRTVLHPDILLLCGCVHSSTHSSVNAAHVTACVNPACF